jgi:hypothetical protein
MTNALERQHPGRFGVKQTSAVGPEHDANDQLGDHRLVHMAAAQHHPAPFASHRSRNSTNALPFRH